MYRDPERQRAYLREWRKRNPRYMRDYYQTQVKPLSSRKRPAVAASSTGR